MCKGPFRYAPGALTDARGIYSIGAVARMLGLSQPAIRSWEDRYGLIVAERSEGGRRLYTRDQVEQLRFVKERVDEGLPPPMHTACSPNVKQAHSRSWSGRL